MVIRYNIEFLYFLIFIFGVMLNDISLFEDVDKINNSIVLIASYCSIFIFFPIINTGYFGLLIKKKIKYDILKLKTFNFENGLIKDVLFLNFKKTLLLSIIAISCSVIFDSFVFLDAIKTFLIFLNVILILNIFQAILEVFIDESIVVIIIIMHICIGIYMSDFIVEKSNVLLTMFYPSNLVFLNLSIIEYVVVYLISFVLIIVLSVFYIKAIIRKDLL